MCIAGTPILRKQLKAEAVPSIFIWTSENKYAVQRADRVFRRSAARHHSASTAVTTTAATTDDLAFTCEPDIAAEVVVAVAANDEANSADLVQEPTSKPILLNTVSQTEDEPPFNVSRFSCDDAGIHYYTRLENYQKFMYILSTLGHSAYHLNYYGHRCDSISVPNQVF